MSDIDKKFQLPTRLKNPKNIWLEYETLVEKYNPIDIGRGYPDYLAFPHITKTLEHVANNDNVLLHQYTRDYGHPRLVQVLTKLYSRVLGRQIDSQHEIFTTVGAQEALFSAIIGHVDIGDEVIIIEPFLDHYETLVKFAGGLCKYIPLKRKTTLSNTLSSSGDWFLDQKELENLFNSKTKVIILSNPNGSFGKVYRKNELEHVAKLCIKWNVLCISDEIYEWIVYKPNEHIQIASLPGMWERTLTIGSGGISFSVTGWKLGWVYGPANLLHNLQMVHQNSVYTGITPIQEVIAISLEKELEKLDRGDCYFKILPTELETKRNLMVKVFTEIGMKPTIPEGGYFMMVDWSNLQSRINLCLEDSKCKSDAFTKWLIKNFGILGIPMKSFYGDEHKTMGENFVRFCFFKKLTTLERATDALKKMFTNIQL